MPITFFHHRIVTCILVCAMVFTMLPAAAVAAPVEEALPAETGMQEPAAEEAVPEEAPSEEAAAQTPAPAAAEEALLRNTAMAGTISAERIVVVTMDQVDPSDESGTVFSTDLPLWSDGIPGESNYYTYDASTNTLTVTIHDPSFCLSDGIVRVFVDIARPADTITHTAYGYAGSAKTAIYEVHENTNQAGVGLFCAGTVAEFRSFAPEGCLHFSRFWYTSESAGSFHSEEKFTIRLVQAFIDPNIRIYSDALGIQINGERPLEAGAEYRSYSATGFGNIEVSAEDPLHVTVYLRKEPHWLQHPGGEAQVASMQIRMLVPALGGQTPKGLGVQWRPDAAEQRGSLGSHTSIAIGSFNLYRGDRESLYRVKLHWYADAACKTLIATENLSVDLINLLEPAPMPAARILQESNFPGPYKSDGLAVYPKDGMDGMEGGIMDDEPYFFTTFEFRAGMQLYEYEISVNGEIIDSGAVHSGQEPLFIFNDRIDSSAITRCVIRWYGGSGDELIEHEYVDIGCPRLGDCDGDDRLNLRDAVLLARAIVDGGEAFSGKLQRLRADVNADGAVNVADVIQVCGKLTGMEFDIMQNGG